MKRLFLLLLTFGCTALLHAQAPATSLTPEYTPEQLDELLAPIALYPDVLVALILPAAAVPSDVTLAARYLSANGDPAQVDSQPWDPSVRALAHYPEVIKWMDDNLSWTQAVGDAYLEQPSDVMKSIQQLRAQARAAGTLVDTPQQKVVMEDGVITIVPAQPDAIYVPQYDPDLVYEVPVDYTGPFLTFGIGYPVGLWLNYECDWDDYGIWIGVWRPGWGYTRDWRAGRGGAVNGRAWRPSAGQVRQVRAERQNPNRPVPMMVHPHLMANAPTVVTHAAGYGYRPSVAASSRPDVTGWGTAANSARPAVSSRPAAVAAEKPATPRPSPAPMVTRTTTSPGIEAQPRAVLPGTNPNRAVAVAPSAPAPVVTAPATPSPQGALFGGYERGTAAADYSNRGAASRQSAGIAPAPRSAPVERSAPAPESRSAPPASFSGSDLRGRH